jgi:hypothetical protein
VDAYRPATLEYVVIIEDPTVVAAMDRQARVHQAERRGNRLYYEPRCTGKLWPSRSEHGRREEPPLRDEVLIR